MQVFSTLENVPLTVAAPGVLTNASNADGNPITAVLGSTTVNGTLVFNADWSFVYTPAPYYFGTDRFTFKANNGQFDSNVATATISVTQVPTVSLVGTDTTTQGAWRNAYGADGYDIQGDTTGTNPSLPSYASVSISGASTYTWGINTGDPCALQNIANSGDIASTWYSLTVAVHRPGSSASDLNRFRRQ